MNIQIADLAGGAAEAAEFAAKRGGGGAVLGYGRDEVEQEQLGLKTAGPGAEAVDGAEVWVSEADGECSLKRGDVVAQDAHGKGDLSRH